MLRRICQCGKEIIFPLSYSKPMSNCILCHKHFTHRGKRTSVCQVSFWSGNYTLIIFLHSIMHFTYPCGNPCYYTHGNCWHIIWKQCWIKKTTTWLFFADQPWWLHFLCVHRWVTQLPQNSFHILQLRWYTTTLFDFFETFKITKYTALKNDTRENLYWISHKKQVTSVCRLEPFS